MIRSLNILFFGNSYSINFDVATKVGILARTGGFPDPLIVTDLARGERLERHLNHLCDHPTENITHPSLPRGARWDVVVLQGHSLEATSQGDPSAYVRNAVSLSRDILSHRSGSGVGTRFVLYQTWARAAESEFYPSRLSDPATMTGQVRNACDAAAQQIRSMGVDVRIARVGDAFERLTYRRNLYDEDMHHPGLTGALLATMILYKVIYNASIADVPYVSAAPWASVDQFTWNELTFTADAVGKRIA